MTDLTTRLNRLAEQVPEVRPAYLTFHRGHWWFGRPDQIAPRKKVDPIAHALWLASILTWLATHGLVEYCGGNNGSVWAVEVDNDEDDEAKHRIVYGLSDTFLEAALSAAEAVAGIQQQETSEPDPPGWGLMQ